MLLRTGRMVRPDILIAVPAAVGSAGLVVFSLFGYIRLRWRKVNGSELLPLVRAGVRFVDGVREKPKATAGKVKENAA